MAQYAIRRATSGDADAVSRVFAASFSTLYRGWYRDEVVARAAPLMARPNFRLLESRRYFVAVADDEIIACGGWSGRNLIAAGQERLAHARAFATHPDHINCGCGGSILMRSISEARVAGFEEMESVSSLAAEAFYAHHGFQSLGVTDVPVGRDMFSCVKMRISLVDKRGTH